MCEETNDDRSPPRNRATSTISKHDGTAFDDGLERGTRDGHVGRIDSHLAAFKCIYQ